MLRLELLRHGLTLRRRSQLLGRRRLGDARGSLNERLLHMLLLRRHLLRLLDELIQVRVRHLVGRTEPDRGGEHAESLRYCAVHRRHHRP